MYSILRKPAYEIVELFRSGSLSIVDYVSRIIERIEKLDNTINAFITVTSSLALERAEELERKVRRREKCGRLLGLPVAVKDNITTRGIETTCASRILRGYKPPFNATVIDRILCEDAIIIGKTNMDEFAMGSTTENSAYGPTRNPWNIDYVPGGSSGGSAAALAAGMAPLALGSDTGGSIRCPAAYTATFGLKTTYGLVSRFGLIPYANSLEQIGPMARNVRDLALLLSVIAGYDPKDSTSLNVRVPDYYSKLTIADPRRLRVAVVKEMVCEGVDERIVKSTYRVVDKLISEGAIVDEVSISIIPYSLPAYYIIAMAEASSNLARYDGVRYGFTVRCYSWDESVMETRAKGFGTEVKRRIMLGSFVLSAGYREHYYIKALKIRRLVRDSFLKVFKEYDVALSPTMPIPPPRIGERVKDPLQLYAMDIETVPVNLAGIPALNIPLDFIDGLPVGLQVMGPPLSEEKLLSVGLLLEEITGIRDAVVGV